MTKDVRKLAAKRLDQLALSPEQRAAFAKMAAREQAIAAALKRGPAPSKPQADLAGKPQQAIIAEALRDLRLDTAVMTTAAIQRRIRDWVERKAKRTGEKIAIPERTSVARYLGRRKT